MEYELIRSARKTVAIQITREGKVVVRCPKAMPEAQVRAFVQEKQSWILSHMPPKEEILPKLTAGQVQELADRAVEYFPRRTAELARQMGVTYGRITIRNQRTKWGSCSSKGNLNFNCTLMLAPREVADYVIIHELSHRKHMDHSPAFWAMVEAHCPNHKALRQWLHDNAHRLIGRL